MTTQAELEAIRDDASKTSEERIAAAQDLLILMRSQAPKPVHVPVPIVESLGEMIAKIPKREPPTDEELERRAARERALKDRELAETRRRAIQSLSDIGPCLATGDVERVIDRQYEATPATKAVEAWCEEVGGRDPTAPSMLVLCGGIGTGKTFAAAVVMQRLGGICLRASRLHIALAPWRGEARPDETIIDPSLYALVVLDDLGTERDPKDPRWSEALFELVDSRMERGRRTLITSNLPRSKFRERYDGRIIDRLNHVARVIELPGKSMRKGGAGL